MSDKCATVNLNNVIVQENGIIRNAKGTLIARLVDDISFINVCEWEKERGATMDVKEARETMIKAFDEDTYFENVYVSNIAMLLHDHYGITDYEIRNKAGKDILDLIFRK